MSTIVLKGGSYLSPCGGFTPGDVLLEGSTIHTVGGSCAGETAIDCSGLMIIPGLIDIHTHGALGYDCMKASPAQLREWSAFLASHGVTSFMPTTITASIYENYQMIENVKAAAGLSGLSAQIEGVHIEGPYISPLHLGCHEASLVRAPCIEDLKEYKRRLGNGLKMRITIAPELEGAENFICKTKELGGYISIGHSDATIEVVNKAINCGADCFTHLFNGMRGIHHREPGTAGAALVTDTYAEIISDGIHLHPDIIRLAVKAKGINKIVAVSDAMQATGLSDGEYPFGGKTVYVVNSVARIGEGNLAGSTLTLDRAVANIAAFADVPLEDAIRTATINPARVIGLDAVTGTLEPGKYADIAVINKDFEIQYTVCRGKVVYTR